MPTHHEAPSLLGFSDGRIANMTLQEVTELLGSEGLQRRCSLEIEHFSPDEQVQLDKAFHWTIDLYSDDSDKETRYREPPINHILRVAIGIMHDYEVMDVNVISAALLHDAVRDYPVGLTDKSDATPEDALKTIAAELNPDVSGLVSSLTNFEHDTERDEPEQYQEHVTAMFMEEDPRVRIITISDFTDEVRSLINMPSEGSVNRSRRYAALIPAFEKAIIEPDTPLSNGAKARIIKELDDTRRRLELFTSNVS